MKITMLGTSGSGKTVYMSAMSELFFNGVVDGYTIANREDGYDSDTFINKGFDKINTLYQFGRFPDGTSSSIVMPLELRHHGEKVVDIDWIDYRGGAIKELALGIENPQNTEVFAALLASDIIMVFVDSAVLKVCNNNIMARSRVGANEISQLLCMVAKKKHIDVIFLLSKIDSSVVNINKDFVTLRNKVAQIYSRFLTETNTSLSQCSIIPVGAIGYGNVETSYHWSTDSDGGRTLVFNHEITNFENMNPINVASSFAAALLKCLESETKNLNTQADKLSAELKTLSDNFGPIRNFLDLLFHGSKTREHIFDLKYIILESRNQVRRLAAHKTRLEEISSKNQ